MDKFSTRYGPPEPEIKITRDFPIYLRGWVVDTAYEAGLTPHSMRTIVCGVLGILEDPNNRFNLDGEVRGHLSSCEWYEVYDIMEASYAALWRASQDRHRHYGPNPRPIHFANELNRYFRKEGIGWQLVEGKVTLRGQEAFEGTLAAATTTLEEGHRSTAAREIRQALQDLSRRPEPDVTGALQHGLAALECVMRDVCDDPKATLGTLLSRYKGVIPAPLDQAVEKIWGFASERGGT